MKGQDPAAPQDGLTRSEQLGILIKSYELAASEIRDTANANDRLVAMGITAIGAGVSYGLVSGRHEVFLALPILLVSVYVYAILNHHNLSFLGGYKRFLEDRINRLSGDNVLIWEQVVASRRRWHVVNLPLIAAYVVILLAVIYLSLTTIFQNFSRGVAYAVTATVCLQCVSLVPALVYWFSAPARAYSLATSIYLTSPAAAINPPDPRAPDPTTDPGPTTPRIGQHADERQPRPPASSVDRVEP